MITKESAVATDPLYELLRRHSGSEDQLAIMVYSSLQLCHVSWYSETRFELNDGELDRGIMRTYSSTNARFTSKIVQPSGFCTDKNTSPFPSSKLRDSIGGNVAKAQDAFGCEQRGPY